MQTSDSAFLTLTLTDVTRHFGTRTIFEGISAAARDGETLVIAGANGSGKSTLARIIAGLLTPSAGSAALHFHGQPLDTAQRRQILGLVAPDLTLYGDLTAAENLQFFARLRGLRLERQELIALLEKVGLKGRGRDPVRAYSSGMRQRLKYAFALLHQPPLLILDEPTANLDAQGTAMVESIVAEQKERGLLIIATNEARERAWGDHLLVLDRNAGA